MNPRWSVWYLCHLFCSEFHGSKHWHPWIHWVSSFFEMSDHVCSDGISFSLRFVGVRSVPLLFVSRTEECPVSSRESLRAILDLFGFWNTSFQGIWNTLFPRNLKYIFLNFLSLSNRCHWTLTVEDDSSFKVFRFNVSILQVFLDLLEDLHSRKSWENIPLETQSVLHQFSARFGLSKFFNWIFPSLGSLLNAPASSPSIRRNMCRRVLLLSSTLVTMIVRKCGSRPWRRLSYSIVDTFRISAWWSNINLCVISDKFWSSSRFVFLKTLTFSV